MTLDQPRCPHGPLLSGPRLLRGAGPLGRRLSEFSRLEMTEQKREDVVGFSETDRVL